MDKPNFTVYIKRTLSFILILIALDQLTGHILKYYFFKQEPFISTNTKYTLNNSNQDILIIGSSHAQQHYIADQIAAKTKMTCFNAGAPGYYTLYSYAVLKSVLARYTPKIIILDIRAEEFDKSAVSYDRLSIFAPFYDEHPELKDILYQRSKYERVKLLSVTYRFNSELLSIISRNIHKNPVGSGVPANNGFLSITNTIKSQPFKGDYYTLNEIDTNFVNTFRAFVKDCKDRHIKLFVFISPVMPTVRPDLKSIEIARQITQQYQTPFFNYVNSTAFKQHRYYFRDYEHMNVTGAKVYTDTVISQILPKLN